MRRSILLVAWMHRMHKSEKIEGSYQEVIHVLQCVLDQRKEELYNESDSID